MRSIILLLLISLLLTCSAGFGKAAVHNGAAARMHAARISTLRRRHQSVVSAAKHWKGVVTGSMPSLACDPDDLLLDRIERTLERAPRVPIAQQLQLGPVQKLMLDEAATTLSEDTCYILEGEGNKLYFICSDPPDDNENLVCSQAADGMDWVCVERTGGAGYSDDDTFDHWLGEMDA